jgi:hypothetical protein
LNTIVDAIRRRDEWGMFANEDNTGVITEGLVVVDCGLCFRFYTQDGLYIPGNRINDAMVTEASKMFDKELLW